MKQLIYILLTTTVLGLMSCSDWLDEIGRAHV